MAWRWWTTAVRRMSASVMSRPEWMRAFVDCTPFRSECARVKSKDSSADDRMADEAFDV